MAQVSIVCSSANHPSRSAQPDWLASLGTADRVVTGMLCPACARLDGPDATAVNATAVKAALAQAIIDMGAVITDVATLLAGAAMPAGAALTTTQLTTVARQHDAALRTAVADLGTVALRVKQAARLLNGDFSSST